MSVNECSGTIDGEYGPMIIDFTAARSPEPMRLIASRQVRRMRGA